MGSEDRQDLALHLHGEAHSIVSPPAALICPPQVESVIGIAVFAVYLLFHFCAVEVHCPSPSNRPEELAFVFYTTYIKNKGQTSLLSTLQTN